MQLGNQPPDCRAEHRTGDHIGGKVTMRRDAQHGGRGRPRKQQDDLSLVTAQLVPALKDRRRRRRRSERKPA